MEAYRPLGGLEFAALFGVRNQPGEGRSGFTELLGGFPAKRVPLETHVLEVREFPGYHREKFVFLPREIGDKGTAVRHQLSRLAGHVLPIYAGDDRTDESAFAALSEGITIRVGRRALTRAQFQLRDPGEVRSFLEKLGECLQVRRAAGR
ncbi:hypothetical protein SBA4_7530003 [Candidatus Sulfopaludibacter sp. SbA4]|nr:hypothetical protein SBA4_7530003 [Candidatus Sulfopaludibacter sp. SbA4]